MFGGSSDGNIFFANLDVAKTDAGLEKRYSMEDSSVTIPSSSLIGIKNAMAGDFSSKQNLKASKQRADVIDMTDLNQDLVDAKIKAANAELRTDFARLEGTVGEMSTKLDHVSTTVDTSLAEIKTQKWQLVGLIVAIALGLFAVLAWGQGQFNLGASVDDRIQTQISEANKKQNERVDDRIQKQISEANKKQNERIDKLLSVLEKQAKSDE